MTNDKEGGIIQKNNRGGAVYGRKQKNEQKFWGGGETLLRKYGKRGGFG